MPDTPPENDAATNTPDAATDASPNPSSPARTDNFQRADPRFDTAGLDCHAGRVLDLSAGGMRLLVPWKQAPRVGDPGTYIFGEGADEIRLMGTVRWIRPAGRIHRRAEVGVEFVGLTPAKRDGLRRLAVSGDPGVLRDAARPEARDTVRVEYPDLYRMFAVSPYASQDDLRRAYHLLAKELHPDRSPDPDAAARFAELNKAYTILRDKDMRAKYDERLAREQQRAA